MPENKNWEFIGSIQMNSIKHEYPRVSLNELDVKLYDCVHETPQGVDNGYPYIAIPNVQDGRLDLTEVRQITKEDYIKWTKKFEPREGDIIVTRRGRVGDSAPIPKGLQCAIGQNLVVLRSEGDKIEQSYLRWVLCSREYWEEVGKFLNVGAIFDSLNCRDIPNFNIPSPPIAVQRKIAQILNELDDKIQLNRKMNATLEQIAQALFRSWFIDFDPVKAKAAGKQPQGIDAETAALFPSEFEQSELGMIPKGWRSGKLGEICYNYRETVSPEKIDPTTLYIGLEHMPRKSIALDEWSTGSLVESGKSRFIGGDILFGKLRPYFHKVGIAPIDGICSTDILVIRPKDINYFGIALSYLSSVEIISYADRLSNGAKMPRISWNDLAVYEIPIPPQQIVKIFSETISCIVGRIRANILEFKVLSSIRDIVLPQLISGKLRVYDDIEKQEINVS